jgi:tetratricopeptide (TPR) repeat protein
VALSIAMLHHESSTENRWAILSLKASPKFALSLAFIFMIVSAGVVFMFVFVGKIYFADALAATSSRMFSENPNGGVEKLTKAINWHGKESRYYTMLSQQLMAISNQEALKGKEGSTQLIQQNLNDAVFSVNKAKELSKNDIATVEAGAQVYENSGLYAVDSLNVALDNYKRALELEPHNPVYFLKIGEIKLSQASSEKDKDKMKAILTEAKDWMQKSVDEKKDFAEGYYQLSVSNEALGDLDGSISSIENAASIESNNGVYIFNLARLYQARGNKEKNDLINAESLYKAILSQNDKEVNTHFSLASLYEKTNRSSDAISEYKKVLELVPADNKDVREKIEKMISNVQNGIENTAENILGKQEEVVSATDQQNPSDSAQIPQ